MPLWLQIVFSALALIVAVLMPLFILLLNNHKAEDDRQHAKIEALSLQVVKLETKIATCSRLMRKHLDSEIDD